MDRGFGIEVETTYADDVAKSAYIPAWWSEAESIDFKLNDEPVVKSGVSRMNQRARAGVIKPTGSTSADADLQRLTWYMYGYLDNYVFTAGDDGEVNVHEYYGGEGKELPSFRGIAVFDMLKKYIRGMLIDQLSLEVSDESMTVGCDWIYASEKAGIIGSAGETFTRPADLEDDLFIMFYDVSLKLNNAAVDGVATNFQFSGNNNHDVDATIGFGSRSPQIRARAGKRENELTIETTLTESTVRAILDAEYGAVGALEPSSCQLRQIPLELNVSLCELDDVEMKILFPNCTVRVEYDMSGADSIGCTMTLSTLGTEKVTLADETTEVETDMYVMIKNLQDEIE